MDKLFYMKAFEVIVLSGIAWVSAIRFMFCLFRLKAGTPWVHSALLSMIMMIVSWAIEIHGGISYVAALQFTIIFLYLAFVLRLKWFHALLVDAIGCLITLFVMVVCDLPFAPPEELLKRGTGEHPLPHLFVSLLTFAVFTAAVRLCDRYRLGFTFVGTYSRMTPIRLSYKLPLALFIVTFSSVLVFPPSAGGVLPYLLVTAALSLFFLLRWSLKYEMTE